MFVKRSLAVTFTLGTGSFDGGQDSVLIENLMISADIEVAGMGIAQANISISGLSQDLMDRLTTLKISNSSISVDSRNKIKLETVINDERSVVFEGGIVTALADYNAAPDVPFEVTALSLYDQRLRVPAPKSYKGAVKAQEVFKELAGEAGLSFEDNGVDVSVRDLYLTGSAYDMMMAVSECANIDFYIDGGLLAITRKNEPRTTGQALELNEETGLNGWPSPTDIGCDCVAIYSPLFRIGTKINITSADVKLANGEKYVYKLSHRLESVSGGAWFSVLSLSTFQIMEQ